MQEAPCPRKPQVSSFSACYCPLVALLKIPSSFYLLSGLPFSPPLLLFFIFFLLLFASNVFDCIASLSNLRLAMLQRDCVVAELV